MFNQSLFSTIVGFSLLFSTATFAQEKARVLFVHMFEDTRDPHFHFGHIWVKINTGFEANGYPAEIIWANVDPKYGNKKLSRLENLTASIKKIGEDLSKRNEKITHIFIAGHGASQGGTFVIGDLEFSSHNLHKTQKIFKGLKGNLADSIQVFLMGCSAFKGTQKEVHARANLLRHTFPAQSVEVFGYKDNVSVKLSDDFSRDTTLNVIAVAAAAIFMGTAREHINNFRGFRAFADDLKAVLVAIPIGLVTGAYNVFLRQLSIFTPLREYINSGDLGYRIVFENGRETEFDELLGYDYFQYIYAQPIL